MKLARLEIAGRRDSDFLRFMGKFAFAQGTPLTSNTMKKTVFIASILLISVQFTLAGENNKPNVLFLISDDLTTTATSSYEGNLNQTPHIDQLAADGTRFSRAYSQFPVCGPSRASIMFGYYPNATTAYGYVSGREEVGPDRFSLPQLFRENGYFTARVGKIFHMGSIDVMKGRHGTDDEASWVERYNSPAPEVHAEGEKELVQRNPYGLLPTDQDPETNGRNLMNIVKTDEGQEQTDAKTADKAIELIRERKDEPFFLAVGFFRPHVPFVAPKSYFEPYPYEQMTLPPKVQGAWDNIPERGINYVTTVNSQMTEEQEKKAIAAYYATVSFMDAQVGRVLQALREEGLEENTIVVFTSDHGFHLGEHGFWMKFGMREESVRVPLIIKAPGKEPAVSHSFAELLDLYPTLAELAGLKYSKHLQGKSLAPVLDDPAHAVRDAAFSMHKRQGNYSYLLRTDNWAYIQYDEDGASGAELYDMRNDPKQFNNLAGNPLFKPVIASFREQLADKLRDIRDNDLGISYGE